MADGGVPYFEALARRVEEPATHQEAARELEQLRASPSAIALSRAVIQQSKQSSAQMHAIMLIRQALIRAWPTVPPPERQAARDWCLTAVVQQASALPRPVITQFIVTVAVLWKRGWLEEPEDAKKKLFEQVGKLFGGEPAWQMVGVRLCLTLVQEMDAVSGAVSKGTALGMPREFHKETARAFQAQGLMGCFTMCSKLLLTKLHAARAAGPHGLPALLSGPDAVLLQDVLETLNVCLSWDFADLGDRQTGALVKPPATWRPVLADDGWTLPAALFELYKILRTAPRLGGELARSTRGVLLLFAGLRGAVFATPHAGAVHGVRMAAGFAELLRTPLSDGVAALLHRDKTAGLPVDEQEYFLVADTEASEACKGLDTVVSAHDLLDLLAAGDVPSLLTESANYARKTLETIHGVAQRLHTSLASVSSRGEMAAAKASVEQLLEGRYASAMDSVESVMRLWSTVIMNLNDAAEADKLVAVTEGGVRPDATIAPLMPLIGCVRTCAPQLYATLIRTRITMQTAMLRCEVNDDDPYEDEQLLQSHMDDAAMLGRFCPAPCLQLLTDQLAAAHARVTRVLAAGPGRPDGGAAATATALSASAGDPGVEASMCYEELLWLLGYAGHLLADDPAGEVAGPPASINALCKTTAKVATAGQLGGPGLTPAVIVADPVVRLTTAVLRVCEFEQSRLLMDPSCADMSPLLSQRCLWFLRRWAATYLLARHGEEVKATPVAPTLFAAYGADGSYFAGGPPASPATGPLRVAPVTPGPSGCRPVLEFTLQTCCVLLCLWGGNSEEEVIKAGVDLLYTLTDGSARGRYVVLSPTWAALVDATMRCISGEFAGASRPPARAPPHPWHVVLPLLSHLPINAQRDVLSKVLRPIREIGAEMPGYADVHQISFDDSDWAAELSDASKAVVSRWAAYYQPFVSRLAARMRGCWGSEDFKRNPFDARLVTELDRLLALSMGLIASPANVLLEWHLPATMPTVSSCPVILAAYRGKGPVVSRAIRFLVEFVEIVTDLPSKDHERAVFTAIADTFNGYRKLYSERPKKALRATAAQPGALAGPGSPGAAAPASLATVLSEEEEEELLDHVGGFLSVLQRICENQVVSFSAATAGSGAGGAGDGDASVAASRALLAGLAFLVPLLSEGFMAYPVICRSYMSIVSEIMQCHPALAVALPPELFASFTATIEVGIGHHDTDVARAALQAVRFMVLYQLEARRKQTASLDFSAHLSRQPDLFARFVRAILKLILSPAGPGALVQQPAGDALLCIMVTDPESFRGTVGGLLRSQRPEIASRLGHEFTTLSACPAVQSGITSRVGCRQFNEVFDVFVKNLRGITTVF